MRNILEWHADIRWSGRGVHPAVARLQVWEERRPTRPQVIILPVIIVGIPISNTQFNLPRERKHCFNLMLKLPHHGGQA